MAMRIMTTKRHSADGIEAREVAKQARRERLARRWVERRVRWNIKQGAR